MRLLIGLFIGLVLFSSCSNSEKTPDVSGIKIALTTQRFEKDFFAMDTSHPVPALMKLQEQYPSFFADYSEKILGIEGDGTAGTVITSFLNSYRSIYDSANLIFSDFSKFEKQIIHGLQFVKYYFPSYKQPTKIITFIGPLDASYKTSFGLQGDILTIDAICIGLQLHMGKDFSFYRSEQGQQLYPAYISSRFEPNTISINCFKNIVDDLFPEKLEDKTLVQQMVEKGKRMYVLSKLLPGEDEYKLIGYTATQLKDCYEHERNIWDLFAQNNLLQSVDNNVIKNYIGESPKTQELGDASPGNIGAFTGWQIVKKYMGKFPDTSLQKLMATDADIIFQEAKYKP
jgi:hypothetical protein